MVADIGERSPKNGQRIMESLIVIGEFIEQNRQDQCVDRCITQPRPNDLMEEGSAGPNRSGSGGMKEIGGLWNRWLQGDGTINR